MKKKKRLIMVILPVLAILLISVLAFAGHKAYRLYQYYVDSMENQYRMDISVSATDETAFLGVLPADYEPGQNRTITFTVSNNSFQPVQLREVLLLSVFDQAGNPVTLDGSAYTTSSLELLSETQPLIKALENHQAVYACEYSLNRGKPFAEELLHGFEPSGHMRDNCYTLTFAENSPYENCLIRADLLLFGKPAEYPYADWELLITRRNILENTGDPDVLCQHLESKILVPAFTGSQEYHWEMEKGNALLVDIGNVTETDIVIPSQIWLSETENGFVEDPIWGTCYDVRVKGNAFYGNQTLKTVTFQEGVCFSNNAMWDEPNQGMFGNCSALTAVYNLPDSVVTMEHAFRNCSALEVMPTLPEAVENLSGCFYNCSSLVATTDFPENITNLADCFYNCTSLETVQPLPNSVISMYRTFNNCTALSSVPNLPASLKRIDYCFQNCENLVQIPVLPDGITNMASTFYNCVSLTTLQNLPESLSNLQNCFVNCKNLETLPPIPENCFRMNSSFYGCSKLSGTITVPNRAAGNFFYTTQMQETFYDCISLDAVVVNCCPSLIDADTISNVAPVTFSMEHTSGICEGCHYANGSFDVNGFTVEMVDIPEDLCLTLIDLVAEEVPDDLKDSCSRLIFTPRWNFGEHFYGIYFYGARTAYIRVTLLENDWRLKTLNPTEDNQDFIQRFVQSEASTFMGTIYHELAHGYDRYSGLSPKHSDSSQWRQLHNEEGSAFQISSELYAPSEYRAESFARAISRYFTDPDFLLDTAPGMYAYIDELFGDAA